MLRTAGEAIMQFTKGFLKLSIAGLLGVAMLAAPMTASAQYRYRSRTHTEDTSRNNAIALGAVGIILLGNHQKTLGAIALGAAAVEAVKSSQDIDNRHDRYDNRRRRDRNYGYGGGYDVYGYDNGGRYRDRDRDRDDYGYRSGGRDRDRDRDRDCNNDRRRRDSNRRDNNRRWPF